MPSRRDFLKTSAVAGAAALVYGTSGAEPAWAFYQSSNHALWQTAFRGVGPGGIPVAAPDGMTATGAVHYTIDINQFMDDLGAGGLTKLWGFNPANPLGGGPQPQKHLGGILVAQKGVPIQITFRNHLPPSHIIPVDTSIMGANDAQNRTAVHLHGGFVPWISDGGPFDWWTPDGRHGPSFLNNQVLNPGAAPNEAEYYYPNDQSARLVWYHDHAFGITRINAYAGIATAYVIRDNFEAGLKAQGLPPFIEESVLGGKLVQELPIVVQDKIFVDAATINTFDPSWSGPKTTGSLWYAHTYDPTRWTLQKGFPPPADPSVVAEFFGDTMLANGTVYPEATVEPRRYRLRILNACNARFLNLQLYVDDGTANGITLDPRTGLPLNAAALNAAAPNPTGRPTGNFLMLGNEGGFLPSAVYVPSGTPFNPGALSGSLLLGPAERADVIFDFSNHAGQDLILYTDAPAPFPFGDPRNDYFPGFNTRGNPVNGLTPPGFGPNTRVIMRFKVATAATLPLDPPLNITKGTNLTAGNDPLLAPLGMTTLPVGVPVRQLTLNETFDAYGRLIQLEGTNVPLVNAKTGFGRGYLDAATEVVNKDAMEVWQIANLTGDTHPIHFHLVNVQIISRQPFSVPSYNGVPSLMGAPIPPNSNERGWKETVRMNPGEVTTVIMKFKLPTVPFTVPSSPRPGASGTPLVLPPGTTGTVNEYVWHCHILEHEEHDMMRPLVVISP